MKNLLRWCHASPSGEAARRDAIVGPSLRWPGMAPRPTTEAPARRSEHEDRRETTRRGFRCSSIFFNVPALPPRRGARVLVAAAFLLLLLAAAAGPLSARAEGDPLIQKAFETGTLTQAQAALEPAAAAGGAEAPARRYALAVVQFLRAGEKMGQSWRRFGLNGGGLASRVPFLRLPAGSGDPGTAAEITYEDFRGVFAAFIADVQAAEAAFAALPDDPGKVRLRPGMMRFDYAGNGNPEDTETVWRTYQKLNLGAALNEQVAGEFLIAFDAGDVPWFRGYCHLLSALAETLLGYDEARLFDHSAGLFFARPKTSFPFLLSRAEAFSVTSIADLIAFIHLLDFPVREPARLAAALDHLTKVPALSRESWRRIGAESDDDREWVPNPRQAGVLPRLKVTQERIDAWLKTLDEVDALLAGRKLLPFWRSAPGAPRGVNLRRVFLAPTPFDLVRWAQGSAAAPYVEEGTLTDPQLWRDVQGAFAGEALGFALFFN